MLTKEQAMSLKPGDVLHHVSLKNHDNTPIRVRVNGRCILWARRPESFRLPVKHGLYTYLCVDERNADEWVVA